VSFALACYPPADFSKKSRKNVDKLFRLPYIGTFRAANAKRVGCVRTTCITLDLFSTVQDIRKQYYGKSKI